MRQWSEVLRNLSILSQFGLSLIMPLLLCLFLCYWLTARVSLGSWVYIPGFFFGLGGSCMTAWKFYQSVLRREEKEQKGKRKHKETLAFNRHD